MATQCSSMNDYVCMEEIWNVFPNKSSISLNRRIAFTKQVSPLIEECTTLELKSIATKLSHSFLRIELKSPLKRAIATILITLYTKCDCDTLGIFTREFQSSLEHNDSISEMQLKADNILACLDNFKVGEVAVTSSFEVVFRFICQNLNQLKDRLESLPSPQETTNIFNVSQALLKALSLTLQEYESSKDKSLQGVLTDLYPIVTWFLESENVVLNCKLSSGITYINLLRKLSDGNLISLINEEKFRTPRVELNLLFTNKNASLVTQLCLWNGLLVSLSNEELLLTDSNSEFILIKIFNNFCSLGGLSNEESAVLISFSRSLLTWTEKTHQLLKIAVVPQDLKTHFNGACSPLMKHLFDYVFANWDHTVDCLRHHARDIFRDVISFHWLCFNDDDKFLTGLARLLINLPWHCKGKYGALSHLVEIIGAIPILLIKPNVIDDIVLAMCELSLAPHVSEFLIIISKFHHPHVELAVWEEFWLDPIIRCLCFGNKVQKSSIQQYVLPKIFQTEPKALHYMVSELATDKFENKERSLCVTIAIIKTAKCCKIPFSTFAIAIDDPNLWRNCLPYNSISMALCHAEEQVRLDALSIVCDSPKVTEPLVQKEIDLLKFFFKYNLNIQSPAFRQKMVSLTKKMFTRIKLNSVIEIRKMGKVDRSMILQSLLLSDYLNFLNWFNDYLIENLFPEANFPRRCTALQLLVLLNQTFSDSDDLKELPFQSKTNKFFAQTLWDLLRDTYENNKELVLELFSFVPVNDLRLEEKEFFNHLLQESLLLASSSRPPDSVTAAYMLQILTKSSLCVNSASQFCAIPIENIVNVPHTRVYAFLLILTQRLEIEIDVAYTSLLKAASSGPLYGIMTCIRTLLANIDLLNGCNHASWRELVQKIVTCCLAAGSVVQPIVCNASPEGHLPMDTNPDSIGCLQSAIQRAIGRRFTTAVVTANDSIDETYGNGLKVDLVKTKAVTAQMLLLCSWRAHKEVSLLLGLLAEKCSVGFEGLFLPQKFLEVGNYFTTQLSEIKHRGAFEQAYVGFTKLCYRLWRSKDPELHNLPEKWLNELIEMISETRNKNESSTGRRSGGVPFIVQALLVSEPISMNRRCLKKAVPAILELTKLHYDNEGAIYNSQIHAMNVLRALYRDAQLGEDIMPFVSDGIEAALLGFKSKNWGVRNSATLLFTTLVTRVFGVNRSRNEPNKKNCLTGRVFFQRFPNLFDLLLSELETATLSLSTMESSSLHPILLLLSRLYPSPVEGSASYVKLDIFVNFVERCATSSPVWWTRILASQALVPLLRIDDYCYHLDKCFVVLISTKAHQNEIHGQLLKILAILKDANSLPGTLLNNIESRVSVWLTNSLWLMSELNECEATKCAYLEVVHCLASHFSLPAALIESLVNQVFLNTTLGTGGAWLLRATLNVLTRLDSTETSGQEQIEKLIIFALSTDNYEMQIVALDYLTWLFDCDKDVRGNRSLDIVPFKKNFDWFATKIDKDCLKIQFEQSLDLRLTLLQLAAVREIRPWCLAEVYLILSLIAIPNDANQTLEQNIEELKQLMEKIETCLFDDVADAMVPYSGCLVLKIYKMNDKESRLKDILEIVEKWSIFIVGYSTPDNSSSRRLAITETLINNALIMTDSTIGPTALALWDAAMRLVQDDEPEIRSGIANLMVNVEELLGEKSKEKEFPYPTVTSLAMFTLVRLFSLVYWNENYCLSLLIAWALRCELDLNNYEDQSDEQPFDKGEMNVFFEELPLTRLCCERILIGTDCEISKLELFKPPWIPLAFNLNHKDTNTLNELIENVLEECLELSSELSTCDLSHIYLCHLVDGLIVKLKQRLLLIHALLARRLYFNNINNRILPNISLLEQRFSKWRYPNALCFSIEEILRVIKKLLSNQLDGSGSIDSIPTKC